MLFSTDASFQPSSVNLISHLNGVRQDFSVRASHVSLVTVVIHHVLRCCSCLPLFEVPADFHRLLLIELVMFLKSDVLYF